MFDKDFHNIKPRFVRCRICNKIKKTNEPNPKCETCGWDMITILKFMYPDKKKEI